MKGVTFTAQGVAEITDEAPPERARDQMLLRTLYSAVSNGTERSFLVGGPYGGRRWPNRIGYLTVSEVVEAGPPIERFAPGDVVYTGTFPGHVAYHVARESDLIVGVPDGVSPASAAMLGLAGVAFFNARRAGIGPDDEVLVTGAGGIGLMAVQSARALGARVTLTSRSSARRGRGLQVGAHAVFDPDGEEERLRGHGPYTALLECAGAELDPLMDPRKALLARFARVALIAGRDRVEYPFLWASTLRLTVVQSTHFDQDALERVTRLAEAGQLDLDAAVTDVRPIDTAVELYERLRDDPLSVGGTVFRWET